MIFFQLIFDSDELEIGILFENWFLSTGLIELSC